MKWILALSLTAFCYAGCNEKTEKEEIVECFEPGVVTVTLTNCAGKTERDITNLCFIELNDSRCPASAVCIRDGAAVTKFSVRIGTDLHQVTLATKKIGNGPSTDTVVAGTRLRLVSVLPYPGTSNEPARATLQIN